jgi:hypothetical protein
MVFEKNANFFTENYRKAENCNHNIDPRFCGIEKKTSELKNTFKISICSLSMSGVHKLRRLPNETVFNRTQTS